MARKRPQAREVTPSKGQLGSPQRSERLERRSPLAVLLRVCGFSAAGRIFSELSRTRNISPSGCCIRLRTQPLGHAALAVQVIPRETPQSRASVQMLYQIAWLQQQGEFWEAGLFSLGGSDLLQVAFASHRP